MAPHDAEMHTDAPTPVQWLVAALYAHGRAFAVEQAATRTPAHCRALLNEPGHHALRRYAARSLHLYCEGSPVQDLPALFDAWPDAALACIAGFRDTLNDSAVEPLRCP